MFSELQTQGFPYPDAHGMQSLRADGNSFLVNVCIISV